MANSIVLRPWQQQILEELEFLPSIALFMGTGSGKTYTSLFKVLDNGTKHLLVICPSNVIGQWQKSIKDVMDVEVVEFKRLSTAHAKNEQIKNLKLDKPTALVVSLQVFFKLTSIIPIVNNDWTVIVDESHRIKELGTKRDPVKVTHAVLQLKDKTQHKVILTATPTQKTNGGYIDYYTQLSFLGALQMTVEEFKKKYCIEGTIQPVGRPYPIKVITGYKNTHELDALLGVYARRYVPKFIDGDPEMIRVPIERPTSYGRLVKQRAYKDLSFENVTSMRLAKKTLTSGVILGRGEFKDSISYVDNTAKRDWLEEFLSDTDECVVVFYKYNVEMGQIEDVCKKLGKRYIVLNGANSNKVESVRKGGFDVVIGQINACGESIDGMQYHSHIAVYYAMPESSLEYTQSLGRINRMGQEFLPVYYHLVMDGTIDEAIYDMTNKKVEFTEAVLDQITL